MFQCETLLEDFESDIEEWYFKYEGDKNLKEYLCLNRILKGQDAKCLDEQLKGEKGSKRSEKEEL